MGSVVDQFRQLLVLLRQPPIPLVAGWVVWLTMGALLGFWYHRAKLQAEELEESLNRSFPRSKSGVRPPAKPQPKPDAFEELQTLLDGDSTLQS